MPKYSYVAMDSRGKESKGTIEVASQNEAIGRVKEMGLFPTRVLATEKSKPVRRKAQQKPERRNLRSLNISIFRARVKPHVLAVFTRQLATLVEAGMPLLRGLKILEEQEENPTLRNVIGSLAESTGTGGYVKKELVHRVFGNN